MRDGVLRREPSVRHFAYEGMDDGFERLPCIRIRKHERAQPLSIQCAGRIAYIRSEATNDLVQARRTGGDSLASQRVSINCGYAKRLETRTYIALAGGYSTRKRHPPHSIPGHQPRIP